MGSSVSLGREVHVLLKCSWAGGVRWALRAPALLSSLAWGTTACLTKGLPAFLP